MAELIISYKEPRNKLYRTINLTGILDKSLSWKAKGIHDYIRTRPNNWNIWIDELMERSTDNETSLRSGLKELIDKKYLYRIGIRSQGKFARWIFISFDEPTELSDDELEKITNMNKEEILTFLDSGYPVLENPNVGAPNLGMKGYKRIREQNKNNIDISLKEETKVSLLKEIKPEASSAPDSKILEDSNIDVIKFWNSLGKPLVTHRLNKTENKVVLKALVTIKKLRKQFSKKELKESIRSYYNLISNTDTIINIGIPGHLVGIDEFFGGFSSFTLERMRKAKVNLNIKSWFDECLFDKDPEAKYLDERRRVVDKYPDVTEKFKNMWVEKILGGIKPKQFSIKDENCFRHASIKTVDFFESNKKKLSIPGSEFKNPQKLVKYIFEAVENNVNGDFSKVTVGWLCSNTTFNHRLPAYLNDQAIIME